MVRVQADQQEELTATFFVRLAWLSVSVAGGFFYGLPDRGKRAGLRSCFSSPVGRGFSENTGGGERSLQAAFSRPSAGFFLIRPKNGFLGACDTSWAGGLFFCVRLPQVETNCPLTCNGEAEAEKRQETKI